VFLTSSAQPLEHLTRRARGGSPVGGDDPSTGQALERAGGDPVAGFACGDRAVVGGTDPSVPGTDLARQHAREVGVVQGHFRVLELVLQLGQPVGELLIASIDGTGVSPGPAGEEPHDCSSGNG
jgi:hypothetical protein